MQCSCTSVLMSRRIVLLYIPVRKAISLRLSEVSLAWNALRMANARSTAATPPAFSGGRSDFCSVFEPGDINDPIAKKLLTLYRTLQQNMILIDRTFCLGAAA